MTNGDLAFRLSELADLLDGGLQGYAPRGLDTARLRAAAGRVADGETLPLADRLMIQGFLWGLRPISAILAETEDETRRRFARRLEAAMNAIEQGIRPDGEHHSG